MSKNLFILLFTFLISFSCGRQTDRPKFLFTKINNKVSGIRFINKVKNTKEMNIFKYSNFYNGGGIAFGDINNDGLVDMYVTSNQSRNKLYLNKGNFVFEDITKLANVAGYNSAWSTGAVMVDIDQDGFLDIYVCNSYGGDNTNMRRNRLFINNKDNTFIEKTDQYQLGGAGFTSRAIFFDYDLDGDLDLLSVNNSILPDSKEYNSRERLLPEYKWNVSRMLKGGGDKLYANENGVFKDVTLSSGIYTSLIGYGTGATVGDINGDRYPDIYISNDSYERDYLYINNADGTFSEQLEHYLTHTNKYPSSANISDINNDGIMDLFVLGSRPHSDKHLKETIIFDSNSEKQRDYQQGFNKQYIQNIFQLGRSDKSFSEIAYSINIGATGRGKCSLILDMDNDGFKDIYISNGVPRAFDLDFKDQYPAAAVQRIALAGTEDDIQSLAGKMTTRHTSNIAFKNNGGLTFSNVTQEWGFQIPSYSGGASCADLDNDGDLDIVVNSINEGILIYRNNAELFSDNNYIKFKLIGKIPNISAIGTRINIFCGDEIISYEHFPNNGYQSSMGFLPIIGLGQRNIDSLQVIWPDRKMQILTDIEPNQTLKLRQEDASKTYHAQPKRLTSLFLNQVTNIFTANSEKESNDYKDDPFAYFKLSKEGPTTAIGDVNADGLEDLFLGGSEGQEAKLYIQLPEMNWKSQYNAVFTEDKKYEDTSSAFLDIDQDGDLDLIVGSGGNHSMASEGYGLRLYVNDGKGVFSRGSSLPEHYYNTSVIAPFDFDKDGDMDFFVGSRSIPLVYGLSPKHTLIENKGGGMFVKVEENKVPSFNTLGMVTGALWRDMDGDDVADLVVSTDWGPPVILKNTNGVFESMETNLSEYSGWWRTIAVADVNEDGKDDLIFGNQGTNMPYKPTKDRPIKMIIKDIDKDGFIERVLYRRDEEGRDAPITLKSDLENMEIFSEIKKMSYSSYADSSIKDLFPKMSKGNITKQVTESRSMVAINTGEGIFDFHPLPNQVQYSTVNAILVLDVNGDGHKDLLVGGNDYSYKPQFGTFDQSTGDILLGDGKGNFVTVPKRDSGLSLKGKVVNLSTLKSNQKDNVILVIINNKAPLTFKVSGR